MPAPRAVLIDLAEFGMDPGKPWTVTHNKTGRLNPTPKPNAKHTGSHLNNMVYHAPEPPKAAEAVKVVEKPTPAPKPPVAKTSMRAEPKVMAKVEELVAEIKAEELAVEKAAEKAVEPEPAAEKPAS